MEIILKQEKEDYVLENQTPDEPPALPKVENDTWLKHIDDSLDVSCLMLASMVPDLQWDLEHYTAFDMTEHLKEMFGKKNLELKALDAIKIEEIGNMSTHVLKMKSYMDQLERLVSPYPQDLATYIIMDYLPKSYNDFIMNYNTNGWEKPISELHEMLKTIEKNIRRKEKSRRKKLRTSRESHKLARAKERKLPKTHHPKKKEKVAKDDTCFECGVVGHWKRNYPKYLAELKNKKVGEGPSSISIFMIEMGLFTFSSNTWVLDTGCGTHICNSLQGFRKSKELKADKMVLHVGNRAHITVQDLGHFDLCLPSGVYLTLDNVCLITFITINIISVSRLRKSGYHFKIVDDNIHSFLKGIFYFDRPINGIYELSLDDTSNNKSLYQVNTKDSNQI
uniref:Retrovirus-related Pol polyprotein from transposon TNT 1-94-like beta-barrel domain-containing protein n=1 Tax=Lactuca sativa TaxID=4236 RepID=A0A9R1UCD8_LACSA|nr:hypothetical protein LSAT_V11C900496980 [Lactuca sativa]